jgi:hypothetical protein
MRDIYRGRLKNCTIESGFNICRAVGDQRSTMRRLSARRKPDAAKSAPAENSKMSLEVPLDAGSARLSRENRLSFQRKNHQQTSL